MKRRSFLKGVVASTALPVVVPTFANADQILKTSQYIQYMMVVDERTLQPAIGVLSRTVINGEPFTKRVDVITDQDVIGEFLNKKRHLLNQWIEVK